MCGPFKGDVNAMIALQPAVKFNGGGHINHTIFWTTLTPNCTGGPSGRYIATLNLEKIVHVCTKTIHFINNHT